MRALLLAVIVALIAAPTALAGAEDVLLDCGDDEVLTRRYSQAEYRQALAQMPTEMAEYTNCYDVIRSAQLAAAGGRKTDDASVPGGVRRGPGGAPISRWEPLAGQPAEVHREVRRATRAGAAPVRVGQDRTPVAPGQLGSAGVSRSISDLPAPLVVMLAALALFGLTTLIPRRRYI